MTDSTVPGEFPAPDPETRVITDVEWDALPAAERDRLDPGGVAADDALEAERIAAEQEIADEHGGWG